jgi:biopolymer transport protein ExbD
MAEVQQQGGSEKGGKHSKLRAKKASTHIDMTPMVDLAFLLLTFFILTTTFSKPKTMDITMPVKDKVEDKDRTKVPASQTMSVLLTKNDKVIWYMGVDSAEIPPQTNVADFSQSGSKSIHKVLLEKNKLVADQVRLVEDSVQRGLIPDNEEEIKKHKAWVKAAEKKGLIVLIKPDSTARYKNLVDILDEMLITNVSRYAIVDLSESEKELIKNAE